MMLNVVDLTKRFANTPVLAGVTFQLHLGEKALLLGRNGSGKSTLLRIIAGLLPPDSGTAQFAEREPARPSKQSTSLGYVGHASFLYQDLSVEENLRFYARLYGLSRSAAEETVAARLEEVGLASRRRDTVRVLSQGQAKRASIARALLHDPPLLLLDEPFATLDADGRDWLTRWLNTGSTLTVLLATHQMDFSAHDADRILNLADGRIVEGDCASRDRNNAALTRQPTTAP